MELAVTLLYIPVTLARYIRYFSSVVNLPGHCYVIACHAFPCMLYCLHTAKLCTPHQILMRSLVILTLIFLFCDPVSIALDFNAFTFKVEVRADLYSYVVISNTSCLCFVIGCR